MILTDGELHQLTGFTRPTKQAAWLKAQGFTFRVGADGHPKVLKSHVEKVMGGNAQESKKSAQPDFSAVA